jgi:hypothetical protein
MRKLQTDGIFTSDEVGLLEEDGYDPLKDDDEKIDIESFSDEEEVDQY